MSISIETRGEATIVHVDGDLDIYTAPRLKETLDQALGAGPRLVLDLSGVQFVDSTALGVLVGALQLSQANDGDFRLVAGNPFVLKILRITGFEEMFSIYPQLEDAISVN